MKSDIKRLSSASKRWEILIEYLSLKQLARSLVPKFQENSNSLMNSYWSSMDIWFFQLTKKVFFFFKNVFSMDIGFSL